MLSPDFLALASSPTSPTFEALRRDLVVAEYRAQPAAGAHRRFRSVRVLDQRYFFLRIGGSWPLKARGLAFVSPSLRDQLALHGVRMASASTLVCDSDVYDHFIRRIPTFAMPQTSEIEQRFIHSSLPVHLREQLLAFLADVHYPLAVRPSACLKIRDPSPKQLWTLCSNRDNVVKLCEPWAAASTSRARQFAPRLRTEEKDGRGTIEQVVGDSRASATIPRILASCRSRICILSSVTAADGVSHAPWERRGRRR